MTAREVRREAPAKINVFLRVLRPREDGYHDLESLVVPTSLADVVTVREAEALHVDVRGAPALAGEVPAGGLNLALVAALALGDACPDAGGAEIVVEKRIPVAAGLGGGSADAAATILALNELWGCGVDAGTLAEIGERIGSDVPAMLGGGPVLMSGRGEIVAPAEVAPLHWVLVYFDFGVRSPDAYRWWDGDRTTGPDPGPLLDAAAAGDPHALGPLLFNDLEPVVFARHPVIGEAKDALLEAGALGAVMSGSGSSVVGLARDEAHARALAEGVPGALAIRAPSA
ncbi:MAG TPA: 4-(cytidine 5'-diphospho)-2-C-methyl-D-erythritol kinase [Actinomycetota bacterium]|nr:4-(cytidine 5'-diphospho)-2-C-methyl-D-erythritol kinase [Actinomycetota bacterium]